MMAESIRINRFLALAGVTSRRKADELIHAGRVQLNGETLTQVGVQVDPANDIVAVDGTPVEPPRETTVILLHKPPGCLVSRKSQGNKPTIYSLLSPELKKLPAVGRLDFDTDGVLLLTNDGELSRRLQHPRYSIERIYQAETDGVPRRKRLDMIKAGIDLGDRTLAKAEIRFLRRRAKSALVEVKIREGRKHEVKRLLKWAGASVVKLTRVSFAGLTIGKLQPGKTRKLSAAEVNTLRRLTGQNRA